MEHESIKEKQENKSHKKNSTGPIHYEKNNS